MTYGLIGRAPQSSHSALPHVHLTQAESRLLFCAGRPLQVGNQLIQVFQLISSQMEQLTSMDAAVMFVVAAPTPISFFFNSIIYLLFSGHIIQVSISIRNGIGTGIAIIHGAVLDIIVRTSLTTVALNEILHRYSSYYAIADDQRLPVLRFLPR